MVKMNCGNFSHNLVVALLGNIFTSIHEVTSILCYECTTVSDNACGDPFRPNQNLTPVDCSNKPVLADVPGNLKAVLCRKTLQMIYDKTRIIRGCGYIKDEKRDDKACKQISEGSFLYIELCSCTTDHCNGGETFNLINSIILEAAMVLLGFSAWIFNFKIL